MTNRFTDRVAFVAGAGGALGGAVARGLAKEGAKLALFDQNAEAREGNFDSERLEKLPDPSVWRVERCQRDARDSRW